MSTAATEAAKGLGPQDLPTKSTRWVDLLGQPLSRNFFFKISDLNTPLLKTDLGQ